MRIGIIGPESTGKSTLAQAIATRLGGKFVQEYARTFVEQKGTTEVSWDELCRIAQKQIDELAEAAEGLWIFDTELIITKVWFDYAFHSVPEWLETAIRTYPMDLYLLCLPDIPWQADAARSNGSDAIRQELFNRYEKEIRELGIHYYIIRHS